MPTLTPLASLAATVTVPGSKSLTQRALVAAALAQGCSEIRNPLASDDTQYTMAALRALGIACEVASPQIWRIHGLGGRIATPAREIFLGNNGTATRFLSSVVALGQGAVRINGSERMRERPLAPLMAALRGWGVNIASEAGNDCPPLRIQAAGIHGGPTILPEGRSSQYLSSLLLVAPYAAQSASIEVQGELPSRPYVLMTLAVMADFGVPVQTDAGLRHFEIPQGQYQARAYQVEGDASSASYFWGAAAIVGGRVTVANVGPQSLQGDIGLLGCLERMGCRVEADAAGISLLRKGQLHGIEADMGDMPDVGPTLAVVAAFAEGRTVINNIAHLRIKESDRIAAVVTELRRLGAEVEEEPARMIIRGQEGRNLHGAAIQTYEDHRIAMSFALAGLRVPGVTISGADCVAKSFPDFWERLALLATP